MIISDFHNKWWFLPSIHQLSIVIDLCLHNDDGDNDDDDGDDDDNDDDEDGDDDGDHDVDDNVVRFEMIFCINGFIDTTPNHTHTPITTPNSQHPQ